MSRAELETAVDWAGAEGWNPGLHDATPFQAADPEGFLVGLLDGEPIASISVVRYAGGFGFLGFYIVRPEHRGQGHGFALWQAGMRHLRRRTVGLDGVVAQQDNYRKSGYVLAHRNVRYGGAAPAGGAPDPGLVPLRALPMRTLLDLDRRHFGFPRPAFLAAWVAMPESRGLALIRDGEAVGYGVARRCRSGTKLGPVFAPDAAGAEALVRGLAAGAEGPVFLDVPEPHREAVALAEGLGLSPAFETARMYAGPAPELPLNRIFGITSFELG